MQSEEAVALIRLEYFDTPDLILTRQQAQWLCELSPQICRQALAALIEDGFLALRTDGRYERVAAPDVYVESVDWKRQPHIGG